MSSSSGTTPPGGDATFAQAGDENAYTLMDLRGRETNSGILAHGFEHVVDETLPHAGRGNLLFRDGQGFCTKDWVPHPARF